MHVNLAQELEHSVDADRQNVGVQVLELASLVHATFFRLEVEVSVRPFKVSNEQVEALCNYFLNYDDLVLSLKTLCLFDTLKRDLVVLALKEVLGALVDAHVAEEACRQEKCRILHRAFDTLP